MSFLSLSNILEVPRRVIIYILKINIAGYSRKKSEYESRYKQ